MTTPALALPLSPPDVSPAKKKRVLLLDTSQTKRDRRTTEQHSLPEAIRHQLLFSTETATTTATETATEREELL
jgi:hypothetical protein